MSERKRQSNGWNKRFLCSLTPLQKMYFEDILYSSVLIQDNFTI